MKNLIVVSMIFLFYLTKGVTNDYIRIEYVGSANKPMNVIFISKKPIVDSDMVTTIPYDFIPLNYIVYNDEFLSIKNSISSTPRKKFQENDYNGFKITIHIDNCDVAYFITRENSNSLFLKTNIYLNQHKNRNKALINAIIIQKTTNVFYGGQ